MTPAKLRLAQAAMLRRDTKAGDLSKELGVTRQTLYRFVDPKGVIILCETEDRPVLALRPRLEAAGADLFRIAFGRHMDLSTGMNALAEQAEWMPDLRLLVLSPVLTFFGPTSNDDITVRAKIRPLLEWAAARNVAVLGIIHPLKQGSQDVFAGCDTSAGPPAQPGGASSIRLTMNPSKSASAG
jgi:hypothetical protein